MIKPGLYIHTIQYMKPSQIYYQIIKRLGFASPIKGSLRKEIGDVHPVFSLAELDFDRHFLKRFSVEQMMNDQMTFLHQTERVDLQRSWAYENQTALWNFNLHYFEYLFPFLDAYFKTHERQYLKKAEDSIQCWIDVNPIKNKGYGWAPYTISLRLTHWLSFYSHVSSELSETTRNQMIHSIHEQCTYLLRHVEKDKLGNHYFENLKAILLCAIFFEDDALLDRMTGLLIKECQEEILADGMHYELSVMYHNLILEGLLRVAAAMKASGKESRMFEAYIQLMIDAAWSLGSETNRLPLFNDAGDNVAKSLSALILCAKEHFHIEPIGKMQFPEAGYYLFKKDGWKLIVDAGQPGPSYIPGHAHCDALSFELFYEGEPVLMNCGTYAYQTDKRSFFRSTAAHNTVTINHVEQSQCWGAFRMAKRSHTRVLEHSDHRIVMEMTDQKHQKVTRIITLDDKLTVEDFSDDGMLEGYLHALKPLTCHYDCERKETAEQYYAPEYGQLEMIQATLYQGRQHIKVIIDLLKD